LREGQEAEEVWEEVRLGGALALLAVLACSAPHTAAALPDGRGYELVSPAQKNGGDVAAAGGIAGGGVLQAAADGDSVTYGSATSFFGGQGAPEGSQYLSTRGSGGWSAENLTVPIFSGSYGAEPDGVPYQLFAPDLARSLLLSGRHCRGEEGSCPVANPPLAGADATAGYQNYYLRQGGGFEALVGAGDVTNSSVPPAEFSLRLAGASPGLERVVLETCAALTPAAAEVPLGEGCDPVAQNLYRWSGGGLSLINAAPGAELAAQGAAVSATGDRLYFGEADGNLYLREGAVRKQVDADAGGGGTFQTASASGAVAYFTKADHLWRYDAVGGSATDITPAGEMLGVLGASEDGSRVYFVSTSGLYHWSAGTATKVPTSGGTVPTDSSNYPPTTGTARVSADGRYLVFVSTASLTGYNNAGRSQVFRYDADAVSTPLRCLSCRPNGAVPVGPSNIPGAERNGAGAAATWSYKPRVLAAGGGRVFFTSEDTLVAGDANDDPDVYQWEAQGAGTCTKVAGCVDLISSGRAKEGAGFVDASLSGDDVFFITDESLVGSDPGSFDLYDARVGGGFPLPDPPIECNGDSCQPLPSEPATPALGTLVAGLGNPKVHYFKYPRPKHHKKKHKHRKHKHGRASKHGKKGATR
jgi:hypothetical protein